VPYCQKYTPTDCFFGAIGRIEGSVSPVKKDNLIINRRN